MNFENAVIYKIVCKNPEVTDSYVGSTTNFKRRQKEHKKHCNNENSKSYNLKVYQFIRDNGGFDNWEFIEICKANECKNKQDLLKLERNYVDAISSTLDHQIPARTKSEYGKNYWKQYSEINEEKLRENQKNIMKPTRKKSIERNARKGLC